MPGSNAVTWGAQTVRSVLFTSALDSSRVDTVYVNAFGQQPSSYQAAPEGVPFAASQASGMIKIGQATVQKGPGRIDFLLTPTSDQPPSLNDGTPVFYVISPLDHALH